jgi:hypothetical protein
MLFLAVILPVAAQTSSLQGVVKDPQGAAISSAIVTITNTETSAARKTISDESGAYGFLQVLPGPYKLEVQSPGFSTKTSNVTLQVNAPSTLDLQMDLGKTSDVVNVMAETTAVNTENATVGNPFTEKQVNELPLQTRNVVALLSLEPGVSATGQVLGARPDQNNVVLDGADVNDNRGSDGFNAVLPIPLDSVQEFRTTIAGQGADQGHTSGGQVAIVTKSGSNSFHGSVYEYNRNTDFEANDWFSNRAGVARPVLIRNQYGGSLGGPILKNKLFFFYNFEARKDRSQTAKTATVPSDSFRQGIVKILLKSGQTVPLSPSDVQALDPLGIGWNPYILNLMQQYPHGNNPLGASDKGLNFNTLLFNAPNVLNNHAQVGKLDYNLSDKQTISVRGTLNGASQTSGLEQFPGQSPTSVSLDNSRGLSARYTYVITPKIVNALNFGYTRLGTSSTGTLNVIPSFGFTTLGSTNRGSSRIAPTPNLTDDMTWVHGRHTIQFGANWHQARNTTLSQNNEPGYSFSSGTLLGLGADIDADVVGYIQKTIPSAALASNSNVTSAFGAIFGLLNNASATYNYGINGQPIPFGTPITRAFISNSPEFYVQDAWKAQPNLTITGGLRYSIFGVPYEANGVEVVPQTSLSQYFADRNGAAKYGIPNFALPTANITYVIGGPVNHGAGYYPTSYNNFAPRIGVAYSPKGTLERFLGKDSVLRAGAGIVFDNYGNAMAAAFASGGSPGLATAVNQPVNTNYSTGLRYSGSAYPALTPPSGGAFPYTPPLIQGGFTSFTGVASDLKAPYEELLNFNYARPLPKHMTIEVGYAGRLSHRELLKQDFGQQLTNFVDPKSGQSFADAGTILAGLHNTGLTPAQVKANPGLIPVEPFVENMFPGAKNLYIPGSASANLFYDVFQNYSGSWTDTLNDFDRVRKANGGCISVFGCNTFFATQNSGVIAYSNAGHGAYHAMTVSLRRAVTRDWGFDFNYTLSHSIDNGSGGESSVGSLQNAFDPRSSMGPSSFDARHQITANVVFELPVGKGKALLTSVPMWVDEAIGGWQISSLYTFRSGLPLNCSSSGQFNVNYHSSSLCIPYPGVALPQPSLSFDQLGIPSLFTNTNVGADFVPGNPGITGYNGLLRGLPFWNADLSLSKSFRLPKEGMRLQFRAEAYNVLNKQIFQTPSLSITQLPGTTTTGAPAVFGSSTFGEISSSASTPRVLQMALRLEF